MGFPETRHTLVQRIVASGGETDWRQFLNDYWGPVCRFAARFGALGLADSEDVAAETFEALLTNRLLARWTANRSAKLRTLLCTVTRNVISNRARVAQGRARLMREHLDQGGELGGSDAPAEQLDAFDAAWADDLLEQAVDRLLAEYHQSGKGDYFRVLYGRICEEMAMAEVADALGLKISAAENYYKAARRRLAAIFEDLVREHVGRYAEAQTAAAEFAAEWAHLGDYLTTHGGLENAIRRAYGDTSAALRQQRAERIDTTLSRIMPRVDSGL